VNKRDYADRSVSQVELAWAIGMLLYFARKELEKNLAHGLELILVRTTHELSVFQIALLVHKCQEFSGF
jgi:hypothetical protein